MKGINKAILLGTALKNPELSYSLNGTLIACFTMVTNVKYRDKISCEVRENYNRHNCIAFGKTAELVQNYVKRGAKLYLEGSIDYPEHESNGIKKQVTKITVREFVVLPASIITYSIGKEYVLDLQ